MELKGLSLKFKKIIGINWSSASEKVKSHSPISARDVKCGQIKTHPLPQKWVNIHKVSCANMRNTILVYIHFQLQIKGKKQSKLNTTVYLNGERRSTDSGEWRIHSENYS